MLGIPYLIGETSLLINTDATQLCLFSLKNDFFPEISNDAALYLKFRLERDI